MLRIDLKISLLSFKLSKEMDKNILTLTVGLSRCPNQYDVKFSYVRKVALRCQLSSTGLFHSDFVPIVSMH